MYTTRTMLGIIIIVLIPMYLVAQVDSTETETHIFWQSNLRIESSDFENVYHIPTNAYKYCKKIELCTSASVGLFATLDIPKKKKMRGKLIEKAYFAPAFDKTSSYIIKDKDSLGIEKQRIVFDIYEISARFARKELKKLQDSIGGYGVSTVMFKRILARTIQMREAMVDKFTTEIYIDPQEGALEKWRSEMDDLLRKTNDYSTKPEDCYRFVLNEPLDNNYKHSK